MKKFQPSQEDINNLAKHIVTHLNSFKLKRWQKHELLQAAALRIYQTYPTRSRDELVDELSNVLTERFGKAIKRSILDVQSHTGNVINDEMAEEALDQTLKEMEEYYE